MRRADRRLLGLHPGLPQGPHRRARGHHDHHAQLRRRPDRPVRAAVATSCARRASDQPISKVLSDFVRIPQILDLPAIRLHWGFIVALIMAVIVSWFLFKTTKGFELRAAGFNMTAARYAGMSAVGLDHPRDVDLRRPGRPRRVDGGPGHGAPDVQRHQLRLRLQRHRPRAARGQPARRDRDRRAAVRRLADRRRLDAGQDRHPARPAVLHPGAGDHVRRRPGAHPGHLAGRPAQEVDGRARHADARPRNPTRRRLQGAQHDRGRRHLQRARPPRGLQRRTGSPSIGPDPGRRPRGPRPVRVPARDLHVGDDREVLVLDRQAGRHAVPAPDDGRAPVDRDRPRDRRRPVSWQLYRGAVVPVAPDARGDHPAVGRRDPRGAARRQDRQPHGRAPGHARARDPDHPRRVRGHPVRAIRPAQHRDRRQVPHRGVRRLGRRERRQAPAGRRPVAVHAQHRRVHRRRGSGRRRHPRRAPAGLARHPLEGRPDHRRRRHRHRRARDHELPVPARAVQEHRAQHAAHHRGRQAADPGRHPGPRADPVQPDAIRLLHVLRDDRVHVHAVQDALGPPPPGIRREAVRGRHGRHRRDQDPLPGDDPRRHPGRDRGLVAQPRRRRARSR